MAGHEQAAPGRAAARQLPEQALQAHPRHGGGALGGADGRQVSPP